VPGESTATGGSSPGCRGNLPSISKNFNIGAKLNRLSVSRAVH